MWWKNDGHFTKCRGLKPIQLFGFISSIGWNIHVHICNQKLQMQSSIVD